MQMQEASTDPRSYTVNLVRQGGGGTCTRPWNGVGLRTALFHFGIVPLVRINHTVLSSVL